MVTGEHGDFRTTCERTGMLPTALRVVPRAYWPSGVFGSTLCRSCDDLVLHRDHAERQILECCESGELRLQNRVRTHWRVTNGLESRATGALVQRSRWLDAVTLV